MEFENIRPIISGVVGGVIAIFVGNYMARFLPKEWAGKTPDTLVKQNKMPIYVSNTIFLAGLLFGVYLYSKGGFHRSDWRGIGLGFGISCLGPALVLPLYSIIKGRKIGEAFIAYSISQKMPPWLLFSILMAGIIIFLYSIVSIYA